jgi:hypothetical protein
VINSVAEAKIRNITMAETFGMRPAAPASAAGALVALTSSNTMRAPMPERMRDIIRPSQ